MLPTTPPSPWSTQSGKQLPWYFFCFACLYWLRLGYFMVEHTSATTIGAFALSQSSATTVYEILPGRGFEQAASVLGKNYAGTLGVDGWAPYRCFKEATLHGSLGRPAART